ncbi:unnamed protein product [Bursaphelenchus okinawaensis]|uniref:PLAT domain-containing protein n=1 Tax=Bursaphelenchus okinawaensis TaxID=465554 RepID=A0A811KC23_9BILA|nr:unnamed protein product [Bursaphelenchus okinawaensis]CAG9098256.1 unnamed protein product [Bursaphelenchus okinawaensis]
MALQVPSTTSVATAVPVNSSSSRDTDNKDEYGNYSVVVRTATSIHAGTNANIFIQLNDIEGTKTDKIRLKCSISHRKKFQRGHADLFMLVDQNLLVQLKTVEVWCEGRRRRDCWLCHSIDVLDHQSNVMYHFPLNKWLGESSEQVNSNTNYALLNVASPTFKVFSKEDFV